MRVLVPELAQFRPRSEVEGEPNFKQIIPYVVFRCGDAVFCYTRGTIQGESRLHRLRSLGVGGHVAEADAGGRANLDAYEIALRRELDEEVVVNSGGQIRRVGIINDDATPVGQFHLGVVHLYELHAPTLRPRRRVWPRPNSSVWPTSKRGATSSRSWSQICIDAFLRAG